MKLIIDLLEPTVPALLTIAALMLFVRMGYLAGWERGRREAETTTKKKQ